MEHHLKGKLKALRLSGILDTLEARMAQLLEARRGKTQAA